MTSSTDQQAASASRTGPAKTVTVLAAAGPSGASTALAWHGAYLLAIITPLILPVLVLTFVVAPAVWSRKAGRRTAALKVLDQLLGRPAGTHGVGQAHSPFSAPRVVTASRTKLSDPSLTRRTRGAAQRPGS